MVTFKPIHYSKINSRQKEIFNFQKVSALLAAVAAAVVVMVAWAVARQLAGMSAPEEPEARAMVAMVAMVIDPPLVAIW